MHQIILVYDHSFEGLLSALYWSFHYNTTYVYRRDHYHQKLLDQVVSVDTDTSISQKIAQRIRQRFGEIVFKKVVCAYLSEDENSGIAITQFLHHAKNTKEAIKDYGHPFVYPLHKLSKAVLREVHLFIGILRFDKLKSNIYYAQFEPSYDILSLLIPHFEERLSDQLWVIHDVKRGRAVFYNGDYSIVNPMSAQFLEREESERYIHKIWQAYYNNIAIEERISHKRRMQFMPKKYWQYLTEIKH